MIRNELDDLLTEGSGRSYLRADEREKYTVRPYLWAPVSRNSYCVCELMFM